MLSATLHGINNIVEAKHNISLTAEEINVGEWLQQRQQAQLEACKSTGAHDQEIVLRSGKNEITSLPIRKPTPAWTGLKVRSKDETIASTAG